MEAHHLFHLLFLLCSFRTSFSLNDDGVLLLSLRYSVTSDPFGALSRWSYSDETPCSWNGIACFGTPNSNTSRVVGIHIPGARLAGTLPSELAAVEYLRYLDLSGNSFNGTIPTALFSPELRMLSLAGNNLSGTLPATFNSTNLQKLDLSGNGLVGTLPESLPLLPNLTTLSLRGNQITGHLPPGFRQVDALDLSSNNFTGSLPSGGLGGVSLKLLNLSGNHLTGEIPSGFAEKLPATATVDLSHNNLTGKITGNALASQIPEAFAGNVGLCGRPLKKLCPVPSRPSDKPKTMGNSPPAFAAMPMTPAREPSGGSRSGVLPPVVIAGIVIGCLVCTAAVVLAALLVLRRCRKDGVASEKGLWVCVRKKDHPGSSDEEEEEVPDVGEGKRGGVLVTVDGEREMELETLLKASAYILGASGSSIVYKAVLGNGTALAVRRIGEGGGGSGKIKEFEAQVRSVAKMRHPNLVGIRGFYWGPEEKLLISEYVPNGSLAAISYKKMGGSSPYPHLSWETRLRIAKGVARGLAYLHDKKVVHGNIKPSNILFASDMEPKISDFGLDRLLCGCAANGSSWRLPIAGSFRNFGSKRSTHSNGSVHEPSPTAASPYAASSSTPYIAPELYKNIKPSAKLDVYSFGVLLLELLYGRAPSEGELLKWSENFAAVEDGRPVARLVDVAVRGEVEGREEAAVACFRLGLSCTASVPQRRPTMKEVVHVLEKL